MWFNKAHKRDKALSPSQAAAEQTCLHELFEQQAEKTPDAEAVICDGSVLTFSELNHRANVLAHHLQVLQVGPGHLVGIFMDRSADLIIALLAVLKVGAAYVPIDPEYPAERIAYMLADTRASVLLTQRDLLQSLPPHQARLLLVEEAVQQPAQAPEKSPRRASSGDLAYVIYTSGSTGKPKGVQVPHSALVSHALAMIEIYRLTPADCVLQFASISFDVAGEEIFPTLLSGASVVIHPQRASIAAFLEFVQQHSLTVLNLPTTFWQELVFEMDRTHRSISTSVRLVVVGNERTLMQTYRKWRELVGDRIEWMNAYGLTEATITSTIYNPQENGGELHPDSAELVPIGRPVRNVRTMVLDSDMKPVPAGTPGELYIGGAGLAVGYLNLPELTDARFVRDPFNADPTARLYKTGDLASALPDGNLQFLGRADEQVKIRGFRIEPAEIEAAILHHPAVRQVAVVARDYKEGERRLIAYLAARAGDVPIPQLRRLIRNQLPDYMVPALFICLDDLPLLPNGKVDRKNLPDPARHRPFATPDFVRPATLTEQLLERIWSEVLGLSNLSVSDNFFELGGHSL
ncbi:MAG: thioester reductase, partial [Verrucomicrobiales bacterium]|nr:thioester reductase [Verrucomicrobiales bacterium]